jgi:hypothetical protein
MTEPTHFQKRAKERFNMDISIEEMNVIIGKIKSGKIKRAKMGQGQKNRKAYLAVIHQLLVIVIYDTVKEHLVTIMWAPKWMENNYYNQFL